MAFGAVPGLWASRSRGHIIPTDVEAQACFGLFANRFSRRRAFTGVRIGHESGQKFAAAGSLAMGQQETSLNILPIEPPPDPLKLETG